MDLATLTLSLTGKLATNGWDAVCAVNATSINAMFADWYLAEGPTDPNTPIQFVFQNDTNYYLFSAVLGPPEIAFDPDGGSSGCEITMIALSGTLAEFEPSSCTITSVFTLLPDFASVSGSVDLAMVTGTTDLGKVSLNLAAGSYAPAISGLPPTSTQAAALGAALQNYFGVNAVSYHIGAMTTISVSDYLMPKTFDFVVQCNPETTGDGCVLLLIQANQGLGGGTVAPLAIYPIPDGYTASLLVANNALFNGLFPQQLTNAQSGFVFAGTQSASGAPYFVQLTSGEVDLGELSYPGSASGCYSSDGSKDHWYDSQHRASDVVVSFAGLTISPILGGQLITIYSSSWTQGWAYTTMAGKYPLEGAGYATGVTTLSYGAIASVTIAQPSSCVVTFPWSATPVCTFDLNETLSTAFNGVDPGDLIVGYAETALAPVFAEITNITGLDTFALQNILFYPNQSLNLTTGSVPADLLLVGQTLPPLAVSPAGPIRVGITPGVAPAAIPFTASLQGETPADLLWEQIPSVESFGSIDSATGVYTPPAVAPAGAAVRITVTSGQDSGHALIILYPQAASTGLVVGPPDMTLTPGQSFSLTVTDETGDPVTDLSWAVDPPDGTVTEVFGSWQYTAPSTVSSSTIVTLTATDSLDTTLTGTATVTLVPTATLTLSPSATSVATGGQLTITPTVPDGITTLSWLVYPSGAGTVTDSGSGSVTDPMTFTASDTPNASVQVVAYGVGSVAAVGYCSIAVSD